MRKLKISLIAAVGKNNVIGKGNFIPWHIKEDLLRFKAKTENHVVIIGRKTFDSLVAYYKKSGQLFPQRTHIVISRDKNYSVKIPNCFIVNSINDALVLAKEKEKKLKRKEIFIAGGAQIFAQTIHLADKLYLTIVEGKFDGDKFFPDYSQFKKVVFKKQSSDKNYQYTFLDLER